MYSLLAIDITRFVNVGIVVIFGCSFAIESHIPMVNQ